LQEVLGVSGKNLIPWGRSAGSTIAVNLVDIILKNERKNGEQVGERKN